MFQVIKNALGLGPKLDYKQAVKNGAIIVDVRSKGEFSGGHIPGSINVPVETLLGNLNKLSNKNQTIITCCASGMRSGSAKMMLKGKGYTDVHNGGSWFSLAKKIS